MATFSEIRDRVKVVGERAEGVTVVTKPGESAPNVAAGRAALDRAIQEGGVGSLPPDAARSGVAR